MQLFSRILYLKSITSFNHNSWEKYNTYLVLIVNYTLESVASIFSINFNFCTEMQSAVSLTMVLLI